MILILYRLLLDRNSGDAHQDENHTDRMVKREGLIDDEYRENDGEDWSGCAEDGGASGTDTRYSFGDHEAGDHRGDKG